MKYFILIFLSLVLACCGSNLEPTTRNPKWFDCSVNSTDPLVTRCERARAGDFPWLVLLEVTYTNKTNDKTIPSICAGVLLGWDLVLTAANCFAELDSNTTVLSSENITVCANALDRCSMTRKNNQCVTAKAYCKHKDFDSKTGQADIAVVRLSKKLDSTYVDTIDLPSKNFSSSVPSNAATIAGWGETINDLKVSRLGSRYLLKTTVEICKQSLCGTVLPSQICVNGTIKDVCMDYNGGPMIWEEDRKAIHGIGTNFFRKQNCGQSQRLYTSVSHYLNWMKHNFACGINSGFYIHGSYFLVVCAFLINPLMNLIK